MKNQFKETYSAARKNKSVLSKWSFIKDENPRITGLVSTLVTDVDFSKPGLQQRLVSYKSLKAFGF